ncbi:MAG: glycosyltransferase family 2 protein [Candidatus Aenigmarchaeota archaeon]|nr:glycosyltransferase family 2 protein [Candidatus Aenigmarchaeota archaeon]
MKNPKTSIIILNWNTAVDTIECLESLKKQTEKDFEIILVDNASAPSDIEKLKFYCEKERQMGIQLLFNKENMGFAGGSNAGLKLARGEIIISLNNDTVVTEDWLENLLIPFKDQSVGASGSKAIYFYERDKKIVQFSGGRVTFYGAAVCDGQGKPDDNIPSDTVESQWLMGAAFAFRRTIIEKMGEWFCEYFFAYYDEVDICWRIRSMGYRVVYCPKSTLYHKGSASVKINKFSYMQQKLSFRNKYLTFWRNLPVYKFLVVLPFLCSYDLLRCIKYSVRGEFYFAKSYLEGMIGFVLSLNKVHRMRLGKLSDLSLK